jgi:acetyltransferase
MEAFNSSSPRWAGPQLAGIREWHADASPGAAAELADGRIVHITSVMPDDYAAERAFFSALSLTSRYRRFHFGLRELSPEQARAMTALDPRHEVAFVARAVAANGESVIVADARYVRRADTADAEFAIAVADEWQGAGLGRELLERLAAHARAHGVTHLFGDVLWGNNPMIALVRKLGGRVGRAGGDATVVRADFSFDVTPMPR